MPSRVVSGDGAVVEEPDPSAPPPASRTGDAQLAEHGVDAHPTLPPQAPVISASRPPPALNVVKKHALLRDQAVRSYLATMRNSEVLRVAPPWARGLMAVASLVALVALVATFLVRVEQTARGRGVLQVAGGAHAVASQTTGVVVELDAKSGQVVAPGALLARIDSTPTKTALLDAERQITRAQEDVDGFVARGRKEQAQRIVLLNQKIALLEERARNQDGTNGRLAKKLATYDRLLDAGLASAIDRVTVENEQAVGERTHLELREQISATRLQISSIAAELGQELDRRQQEVRKAKDRRDALAFQLDQTEVRSPHGGRVEALVVKVGDTVAVGTSIARLIPDGAPRQIVVFLPEADRAFVQEGAEVGIELDQLPSGEFGTLSARVTRIASDLASETEIRDVLRETKLAEPTYRIELELESSATVAELDKMLRPGSLVTARFVLRQRRLVTLLFEPLKRFFN